MKSNPVKYAEVFGKETKSKRRCKKDRKEVSTPGQYILNEHTGNLEKKEMVQMPSCRKCNGVIKIDAETKVQSKDIHIKVFCNTSIQCEILHTTEKNDKCQIMHEAKIVSVAEDHVSDLESIQMEYVQATSSEETNKYDIAEMDKIQIESRCTSVGKNVSEERTSNAKRLNGKIDRKNDVMYNINGDEYKKFCLAKLCDEELMTKLVKVLYESTTLGDFVKLITQLSEGTLDTMNMSFLLCLEVAKLQYLQTTTAMRFRKETKQFWEVVYRICHGKGLRLFSGSKNQGCMQSGGQRGTYDSDKSNHNFAVPDEKSLRKSTDDLPNVILCGIIEESFKLLDKNKQYVISIDGKKMATGLLKDDIGDINLWGFKEPSIN